MGESGLGPAALGGTVGAEALDVGEERKAATLSILDDQENHRAIDLGRETHIGCLGLGPVVLR